MNIKTLIGLLVFGFVPVSAVRREHLCLLAISSIDNKSRELVRIYAQNQKATVKKLKKERLRNHFIIPFVSIEEYREQFLHDKPHIPQKALLVQTVQGVFALWENETGIVLSKRCNQHMSESVACQARKIFRPINYDDQYAYQTELCDTQLFRLDINAEGHLDLQDLVPAEQ